jgi:hypothetical protein
VIVEPAAFRVFARSPFEYGQDPDANGLGAAALVTVTGVLLHAAATKLAVTSTAATLTWRPVKFVFIRLPFDLSAGGVSCHRPGLQGRFVRGICGGYRSGVVAAGASAAILPSSA